MKRVFFKTFNLRRLTTLLASFLLISFLGQIVLSQTAKSQELADETNSQSHNQAGHPSCNHWQKLTIPSPQNPTAPDYNQANFEKALSCIDSTLADLAKICQLDGTAFRTTVEGYHKTYSDIRAWRINSNNQGSFSWSTLDASLTRYEDVKRSCSSQSEPPETTNIFSSGDNSLNSDGLKSSEDLLGGNSSENSSKIENLLNAALNFLAFLVVPLAVISLTVAGIQLSAAGDNPDNRRQAMARIQGVVIALVAYALIWVSLSWLIPGGLF